MTRTWRIGWCLLMLSLLALPPAFAEPARFRLFEWLPGDNKALHDGIIKLFKLEPDKLPYLQQGQDGQVSLVNPGGAPMGVLWSPFGAGAGHFTLRWQARGHSDKPGEAVRAGATFASASMSYLAGDDWRTQGLTVHLPGPVGPASISFALRGRHGQLDIRHVEMLQLGFDLDAHLDGDALVLTLHGSIPQGAELETSFVEPADYANPLTGQWNRKPLSAVLTEHGPAGHEVLLVHRGILTLNEPHAPGDLLRWRVVDAQGDVLDSGGLLRAPGAAARTASAAPGRLSIDAGGRVLRDGHPVLPLGIYAHDNTLSGLQQTHDLGLDLMLLNPSGAPPELFDKAAAEHVDLLFELSLHSMNAAGARQAQDEFASRKPVAWAPIDEPDLNPVLTSGDVKEIYQSFRSGLIFQSNHSPASVAALADDADVVALDPYPVSTPPRPLSVVAAWMDQARALLGPGKSLWYIQQAFSEAPFWPRPPSAAELHASSWIALHHGARGIVYYSLHETLYPQGKDLQWNLRDTPLWDAVRDDVRQIRAVEPYLVAGGPQPVRTVGSFDAAWWPLPAGKGALLSVVNLDDHPQQGGLVVPADVMALRPLVGGDTIRPQAGGLILSLPPYGVGLFVSGGDQHVRDRQ
jgi:hypothetical protein